MCCTQIRLDEKPIAITCSHVICEARRYSRSAYSITCLRFVHCVVLTTSSQRDPHTHNGLLETDGEYIVFYLMLLDVISGNSFFGADMASQQIHSILHRT